MINRNLVRYSGLAAMVSPILLVIADVMKYYVAPANETDNVWMASTGWSIGQALITLGGLLILGSLVGLYTRQADKAGILGLVAFLMAFVGSAMIVGFEWFLGFVVFPWLAQAAPELTDAEPPLRLALAGLVIPGLVYLAGWVLFGVASLRAKVFPGPAAVLLILGTILGPITVAVSIPVIAEAVLGVGLAWMGYSLWAEKSEFLAEPATAV